jgi:diguanylate cyclase (GGDEF)-like protein
MKRSILALAIILGLASVAQAAGPGTLTALKAIHALTNEQASHGIPVEFEATVTFYRSSEAVLFVEDEGVAIYVQVPNNINLLPGDLVLVKGKTHNSYRPEIFADSITLLHPGVLPKPVPATFDMLIKGDLDCQFVKVHAVVRTADLALSTASTIRTINAQAATDGGVIHINLNSDDMEALRDLLDSEIEAVGVASGRFDGKNQLTGIDLNVSRLSDIKILKQASLVPWSLPVISMGDILSTYHDVSQTGRVHVRGVITYYQPGSMVVLQNGDKTLRIMTRTYTPLHVGDQADATGFPDLSDGFLTLTSAEVKDSQVHAQLKPLPATWQQLSSSANLFDLVSIEGSIVTEVRGATQDEYVLASDGHLFSAVYRHPDAQSQLPVPAMKMPPVGYQVRMTGICVPYTADSFSGPVPFDILLRNFDDVTLIAAPPWLSVRRNLVLLIGVLLVGLVVLGVREWIGERRSRRQTSSLAYIERRRSRILEDISNSQPLAPVIEQITELVSFRLKGAPCWCQIADGAQLGNCPPKLTAFRIIQQEIPARSGSTLGVLSVALDPLTMPEPAEAQALKMATSLSALAIETSRLYNDLRHRSEFDLLTDTHNRFSLDKHLNTLIEKARNAASIFGLIYIDLDEFKQINDVYGHHVGDRYLQEVAVRMKRQLRSHDLLARQGGDEFAALVPQVRTRAEVEEIASRLEHCFDEPFHIEGFTVMGSTSIGIAIYPENGETKDALLNTADAAMYRAKHSGRHARQAAVGGLKPTLVRDKQK